LRDKIWSFLLNITRSSDMSVIITTHYIEEARQADICGLMRNGVILEEDKPLKIMEKYNCVTLEEAFLKICMKQQVDRADEIRINKMVELSKVSQSQNIQNNEEYEKLSNSGLKQENFRKNFTKQTMRALMIKNVLQLIRSPRYLNT
jgi:ABC-type multidrug transport system ATPase subunit